MKVYSELLAFKERLLRTARQGAEDLPERAVHREIAETDAKVLQAEHQRLQRRLKFWRQRERELADQDGKDGSGGREGSARERSRKPVSSRSN